MCFGDFHEPHILPLRALWINKPIPTSVIIAKPEPGKVEFDYLTFEVVYLHASQRSCLQY
jgi:hypothetical protein